MWYRHEPDLSVQSDTYGVNDSGDENVGVETSATERLRIYIS
jgi:hypothetical protein